MGLISKDKLKAVIFDLDGTLIDTEKLYRRFWPLALAHFGYELSDERALMLRSLGRPFAPKQFSEWFGPGFDYAEVRAYRKRLFEEHVREFGVDAKPGARDAVLRLQEMGLTTAIATATDPERTARYLELAGLSGLFRQIISATMVPLGKPAPDVYLHACGQLGLRPGECLAVEDAPNGVRSAHAAGLPVVMVPDQTEPDEETYAMLTARAGSLAEVVEIAGKLM